MDFESSHPRASETDAQAEAPSENTHLVQSGECCHSIASACGHLWQTVWSANEAIHQSRQPNQLLPGDLIQIPPLQPNCVDKPAGKRHRFVKKGTVVRLRLRLVRGGEAIGNEAYLLRIGNREFRGQTDSAGILDHQIPASATEAILKVPRSSLEARILIGALSPASTILGVQARLRNLGYGCDPTGENDAQTASALKWFQSDMRLAPSGNPEPDTLSSLVREHGV